MHFFWQLLNVVLLVALFVFFLRKPLSQYLKNRSLRLRDSLREVYSAREETLARLALVEAQIEKLDREISEVQEKSKKEAQKQRDQIINEAEEEHQRILRYSQEYIDHRFKESQKHLKAHVIEKAIDHAEKQMARELSEDFHNKLVDDFIKQLGEDS